jgi:hypothetical protein
MKLPRDPVRSRRHDPRRVWAGAVTVAIAAFAQAYRCDRRDRAMRPTAVA